MKMHMIFASDRNGAIGECGSAKLPWHIPDDLKLFKRLTSNYPVILGFNTFESLDFTPLPNRHHIVLSKNRYNEIKTTHAVTPASSLTEAIGIVVSRFKIFKHAFIIGGANLYNQAIDNDIVDIYYHSIINTTLTGPNLAKVNIEKMRKLNRQIFEFNFELPVTNDRQ